MEKTVKVVGMGRCFEKDVHARRFEVVFVHFVDIAQVVVYNDDFPMRVILPYHKNLPENTSHGETDMEDIQLDLLFNQCALNGAGFPVCGFCNDQRNRGWGRSIHESGQSHCEAACL